MDESGIYRFLECAEIVRRMLNERGKQTKMKIWRLRSVRGKNTGNYKPKKVRERGNRRMNRDSEKQAGFMTGYLSSHSLAFIWSEY